MSELLASCFLSCCSTLVFEALKSLVGGISRESARIAYCGLFAFSLIVSYVLRDSFVPFMHNQIPWSSSYDNYSNMVYKNVSI